MPKVERDIIIYDIDDESIYKFIDGDDDIYTYKYDQINRDSFGPIDTDNLTVEIIKKLNV